MLPLPEPAGRGRRAQQWLREVSAILAHEGIHLLLVEDRGGHGRMDRERGNKNPRRTARRPPKGKTKKNREEKNRRELESKLAYVEDLLDQGLRGI